MKIQKKYIAFGIILLLGGISTVFSLKSMTKASKNVGTEEMERLGSIIDENPIFQNDITSYSTSEEVPLYAEGDHIVITQAEMDWKIKSNEILDIPNPEQTAYDDLCKLKSEYYYALSMGYECTDEEIDASLQMIRDMYQSILNGDEVTNSEEMVALIDASGGIDSYCEKIRDISGKQMVIEKFYADREQEFEKGLDQSLDINEKTDLWMAERTNISNDIVAQENIHRSEE